MLLPKLNISPTYHVFFCRAAEQALASFGKLGFHRQDLIDEHRSPMAFNRLRYRSREVVIAVAITLAAIAALIATLTSRDDDTKSAQPLALVTPKK